jgi:hypothetical protein
LAKVSLRGAHVRVALRDVGEQRDRLRMLCVRRERDAEGRDRLEIAPARDLDDAPQTANRTCVVAHVLQKRSESPVGVRVIRFGSENRRPVVRGVLVQPKLFVS